VASLSFSLSPGLEEVLIDRLRFQTRKKKFYAVQVTIATTHTSDEEGIVALAKELGMSHGDTHCDVRGANQPL
jgi:hypothetical protein